MPALKRKKPLINAEMRRRGIYLLPNLFTTAALFAGFYAIVQAMNTAPSTTVSLTWCPSAPRRRW